MGRQGSGAAIKRLLVGRIDRAKTHPINALNHFNKERLDTPRASGSITCNIAPVKQKFVIIYLMQGYLHKIIDIKYYLKKSNLIVMVSYVVGVW